MWSSPILMKLVKVDSFPSFQRQAWIEVFLKYNTSIPSSAAVEMVFSIGSDILRPKRSSLSLENFEQFVFIRKNRKCLNRT